MPVSMTAEPSRVHPAVTAFVDPETNTISYVVVDPATKRAAIIDPVLNLDWAAGRIGRRSVEEIVGFVEQNDLTVDWLIETHVHADHLSAGRVLKERVGGRIAIGEKITTVQETFGEVFGEGADFARDGRQFDHLFSDGETYRIGEMEAVALSTPGHTPACMTHVVGDAAFVGDTLFMPDSGTARADFPGGDARTLFQSARRILSLPGDTRIFLCHDYGEGGARPALGDHGGRGEGGEHACARRDGRRNLRRVADETRRDARHAASDPALAAGEHEGGRIARARRRRSALLQGADRRLVTRRPVSPTSRTRRRPSRILGRT